MGCKSTKKKRTPSCALSHSIGWITHSTENVPTYVLQHKYFMQQVIAFMTKKERSVSPGVLCFSWITMYSIYCTVNAGLCTVCSSYSTCSIMHFPAFLHQLHHSIRAAMCTLYDGWVLTAGVGWVGAGGKVRVHGSYLSRAYQAGHATTCTMHSGYHLLQNT